MLLHCQELMDAFEILADRSQVAPGSGFNGVLETLEKMEKLTTEIGICPHCLQGMSEELAGDKAPDVAFGIMLGVIAAQNTSTDEVRRFTDETNTTFAVMWEVEDGTDKHTRLSITHRETHDDVWGPPTHMTERKP